MPPKKTAPGHTIKCRSPKRKAPDESKKNALKPADTDRKRPGSSPGERKCAITVIVAGPYMQIK